MSTLVGWWKGENNTVDSAGINDGVWEAQVGGTPPTIAGTAVYAAGQEGQCFSCSLRYLVDMAENYVRIPIPAFTDNSFFTIEEYVKVTSNQYSTTAYPIIDIRNADRTVLGWKVWYDGSYTQITIENATTSISFDTDIGGSNKFTFGVFHQLKIIHTPNTFSVFVKFNEESDYTELTALSTKTLLMSSVQSNMILMFGQVIFGNVPLPIFHDTVKLFREELTMIKELECFLAKKQASYGAQGDDLTGDNYFPALPDSKVEIITAMTDIETVSATYDHDLAVRGFVNANAELSCYMRSLGDSVEPDYALLARASGWAVAGPTAGKYTITPIVSPTTATGDDLEVWHYLGGIGSNASVLTKIGNVVGNWKITGDVGKPVVFALTGAKGIYVSQAAETMVTSVVKDRTLIPAALPVTVSINSVVYKIMKFSFEGGNTVEQYIDCAETYGFGDSEITKKKIKFAFTCYANAALANPLDAVIAGAVVADVSIIWGKALYKTKIVVDDPQFTDCKTVDVGGLTGWEVTGNATQNDITITQNDDHV